LTRATALGDKLTDRMRDAIIRAYGMGSGTVVQCFGPFEVDSGCVVAR
jgi:hypothetical protein